MKPQKIVGIAAVTVVMLIFIVLFYLIFSLITTDDFDETWETGQSIIAMIPGLIFIVIVIAVISKTASRNSPLAQNTVSQKKCVGCGAMIDKRLHSCPKCYTMQPVAPEDIRYIDHKQHNPPRK
jgi:hypothetical protein